MSASIPGSGPPQLTRRWSRALVAATALAVVAVLGVHLAATFLYNAPANPVSQRYAKQVQWWMDPLFTQNWRLFAPNPISENVTVQARASLSPDGAVTGWFDLSAQDTAAVRGDPVPGHLAENGLRNAWFEWLGTHDANGNPTGGQSAIMQQYLLNLVLDRLHGPVKGTIGSVQVRAITTLIPGPGRTAAQTAPQTRTLDWWTVPANPADSTNQAAVAGPGAA
jgi:hypothetical protein